MKIAIIKKKFSNNGGGAEKYAYIICNALAKRGHSITVFAEKFQNDNNSLKWEKVKRAKLPSLCRTYSFHKMVQKQINHNEFDITYALSRTYPADVFRVAEQLHAVWVKIGYSTFSKINPRHKKIAKLEQNIMLPKNIKAIVTNSDMIKEEISNIYQYPKNKIFPIKNGVNPETFAQVADKISLKKKLGLDINKKIILFSSNNFKIKGLKSAIYAISKLDNKIKNNISFVITGDDSPEPFAQLAKSLKLNNLIFTGRVDNMNEYYACSDLLLYPSLYEPFANVCLEAASAALPIITTTKNGARELIIHKVNGYLIDSADDICDICKYLTNFFTLSDYEVEQFKNSILKQSLSYRWEKHIDELENLLKKLM